MKSSGERAVSGVTSGVMMLGNTVTWRARHFGITFQMTSAITGYEYPGRFDDNGLSRLTTRPTAMSCACPESFD